MVLVVWTPGIGGQAFGIAVTLAGVACCAVYTVLVRARLGDAPSTLGVVLGQQAWALGLAVLLLAGSAVLGPAGGLVREPAGPIFDPGVGAGVPVSTGAWLSAVLSGVVYYALAYGFYIGALRRVSASLAASAFYLIPVFGLAGGWALLGERLGQAQWLGAVIVLASVVALARFGPGSAVTVAAGATTADPPLPSR
jgi:drug/metabolite transporter (DMT)-like permease